MKIAKKDITVIFNYHREPNQLDFIMSKWSEADPTNSLNFIVCDTGPREESLSLDQFSSFGFNVKVLKIDEYKPFNQPLGKNSSVAECETDWVIITDPDRFLPKETLDTIEKLSGWDMVAYDFEDYDYDYETGGLTPRHRHQNTFLMRKDYFEQVGGYNESFCGNYGHDDTEFRERIAVVHLPLHSVHCQKHHSLEDKRERDSSHNLDLLGGGVLLITQSYLGQVSSRPFLKETGTYTVVK